MRHITEEKWIVAIRYESSRWYPKNSPKYGEYDKTGQKAGQTIDAAGKQGIAIAIVVEFIVTGQCQQCPESGSERKEYLRCGIDPNLFKKKNSFNRTKKKNWWQNAPANFVICAIAVLNSSECLLRHRAMWRRVWAGRTAPHMEPAPSPKRPCPHCELLSTAKSTPARKRWTHKEPTPALSVPCNPDHLNDVVPVRYVCLYNRTHRCIKRIRQSFSRYRKRCVKRNRRKNNNWQYSLEELTRWTCCIG